MKKEEKKEHPYVGREVRKHFLGHGWFKGKVDEYDAEDEVRPFHVTFEDGDQEDLSEDKLKKILVPL